MITVVMSPCRSKSEALHGLGGLSERENVSPGPSGETLKSPGCDATEIRSAVFRLFAVCVARDGSRPRASSSSARWASHRTGAS